MKVLGLKIVAISFIFLFSTSSYSSNLGSYPLKSPNERIQTEFFLDNNGCPSILIRFYNHNIITISNIGLLANDNRNLSSGYRITYFSVQSQHNKDTLLWGENKCLETNQNVGTFSLINEDSIKMDIQIAISNSGFAFRMIYPQINNVDLLGESTTYHFLSDGISWSIPANFESYEFSFREQLISNTSTANTPFTFRFGKNIYCSMHEAGLTGMPEMTLVKDSIDKLSFHTWLSPDNSGTGTVAHCDSSITTSWRTISLGRKATDLINSSFLLSLNQTAQKKEFSYAKPLKYIGIWWGMHLGINNWIPGTRHGATTENALRYIDFASRNNIDAVLFEGWNIGWDQWGGSQEFDFIKAAPDFDIEKVVSYAQSKNVQIIMHHETGGNIPNYESQMEQAFEWCQNHGIHYVKTGYAGGFPNKELHHSQYGVNHYAKAMQCAAKHQIALDVHEPIKPTGLRRQFPNLMTAEGARGMEWNAWSTEITPSHETILPFTRLLAGPMDFTPGIFDITFQRIQDNPNCIKWNMKDARECRVNTTIAKQVALWVVIYSPLTMASDLIENYETIDQNGNHCIHPMFKFFCDYNPDCDWSRALQGEPGQFVVIARKAGESFFLGAITNEQSRKVVIPLDFLEDGIPYQATIYADGPDADYKSNPTSYRIYHQKVNSKKKLHLKLATSGGAAVEFKPFKDSTNYNP